MTEIVGQGHTWATEMGGHSGLRDVILIDGVKKPCVPPVEQDVSKGGVAPVIDVVSSTEVVKQRRPHFRKKCTDFLKSIDVFVCYLNI